MRLSLCFRVAPVLVVLAITALASPAQSQVSKIRKECTVISIGGDYSGPGYQRIEDSIATLGDCKAGVHTMFHMSQFGWMQEPYIFVEAGIQMPARGMRFSQNDDSRSIQTLAAELDFDCIPWVAQVRVQGQGGQGGRPLEAWVTLAGQTVDRSDRGGYFDTTLTGCAPVPAATNGVTGLSEESAAEIYIDGGSVNISAILVRYSDPKDYDNIFKQAVVDPWVMVDPAWPYADLFHVDIQACNGCTTWAPMRRDWMTVWTDVSTPAMATPEDAAWATFLDADNDGDLDIHVYTGGTTPDRLYANDGAGGFTEAASGPLAATVGAMGLAWGDYDNDGDLDLFLTRPSGYQNALLRNDGGLVFTDTTTAPLTDNGDWYSPAWADYDRDGDLDLFVSSFGWNVPNRLYRNDGEGTFVNVVPTAVGDCCNPGSYRCGAGGNWAADDGDGYPDLSINTYESGVDTSMSRLYRNLGNGTFAETTPPDMKIGQIGLGSAWGDYDADGDLDFYKLNYNQDSRFFANDGAGNLARVRYPVVDLSSPAKCLLWEDLDGNGTLDVYTGYYNDQGANLWHYDADVDSFETSFWTDWGPINSTGTTSSVAAGDYDNDGDLDLCVTGDGRVFLIRNDTESQNHWLHVDLIGAKTDSNSTGSNRYGIGASIRVYYGANTQMREVTANPGFYNGSSITAEFGLGDISLIDSLEVRWPSGPIQTIRGPMVADRKLTIHEGDYTAVEGGRDISLVPRLLPCSPNPFSASTTIRFDLPQAAPVWVQVFDTAGRLVRTLRDGSTTARGSHQLAWDARDQSGQPARSGIYFVRLRVRDRSWTSRMVVLG